MSKPRRFLHALSGLPARAAFGRAPRPLPGPARRVAPVLLLVALALAPLAALRAQPAAPQPPTAAQAAPGASQPAARPRIGLVLSGGGARGFAHIGVLKVLEELRVPVDVVVGTSMGSIVGGAYAAGHPLPALEALVRDTDWQALLADRPPRAELSFARRVEDRDNPSRIEFGLDERLRPRGSAGAVPSAALEAVLRRLARRVELAPDTDRLPLPFRAMATDLETGEPYEMNGPTLFQVMRASMSVPGVFAPIEVGGRLLADGGLVRNLPVDVARRMGAERLIAVNVGTPLMPRSAVKSALDVTQQMFNILTEQNVRASLAELRPQLDLLIAPDLDGIGFMDFERADAAVARGERAARLAMPRLLELALDEAGYAQWQQQRQAPRLDDAPFVVRELRVQGPADDTPLPTAAQALGRMFGLVPGDAASAEAIEQGLRRVQRDGAFERIDLAIVGAGAGREMVLLPIAGALTGNRVRVGLRLESDLRDASGFSLIAQHTLPWVNAWGGEWRSTIQLGERRRLATSLRQPLGRHSLAEGGWFVAPSLDIESAQQDLYVAGKRMARSAYTTLQGGVYLGRTLGDLGELRLGLGGARSSARLLIPQDLVAGTRLRGHGARLELDLDTLDSAVFATEGFALAAQAQHLRSRNERQTTMSLVGTLAGRVGPWAWQGHGEFARADRGAAPATLGGFLRLSGTPKQSIDGARIVLLRGIASHRIGQMPTGLGGAIRVGAALEWGGAFAPGTGLRAAALDKALSAFIAIDTILGPIFVGTGHTFGGGTGVYVYLGRP
jgi:NTE family protein